MTKVWDAIVIGGGQAGLATGMMEHGISTNKLLAWLQKKLDPLALKFVGCHQDRNISEIVKKSSLKLIREELYMAGYLYLIWAKPLGLSF
ncbi:hypothetical protein ACIQXV_21050 [Neobacillus sp. NPDC097160]|uniref:hypothetical protein n=1 Tax=Neobacillus sp. NPDC097160 TaxID=3364298 RepID=UPI0037F75DA5